jgi:hypothetical protein
MPDLPVRDEETPSHSVSEPEWYRKQRSLERRTRLGVLSLAVPAAVAVTWLFVVRQLPVRPPVEAVLNTVALVLIFASIAGSAYLYLQTGFKHSLFSPAETFYEPQASGESSAAIRLKTDVDTQRLAALAPEDEHLRDISRYGDDITRQLSDAVDYQGRRNNLNLGVGFFITLIGIGVLVYFVQQYRDIDPAKPWAVLNFVPRLSLVLLIEFFAYFFLNLYRTGLTEVKYLQNELTNVRMRSLGLRTAIREGDKESAAHIMKAFGDTDRNASSPLLVSAKTNTEAVLKTAQEALRLAGKVANNKSD